MIYIKEIYLNYEKYLKIPILFNASVSLTKLWYSLTQCLYEINIIILRQLFENKISNDT